MIEKGLQHFDDSDDKQKEVLLAEFKVRNYVPDSVQGEYMRAVWAEYKKFRQHKREEREESYMGIPREEIPWFPKVDPSKCSGCTSCVEFCAQGVFFFAEGKSHAVQPLNCIVGRSSCRSFCPEQAIMFPSSVELRENLKKLKEKHSVKE